MVKWRRSRRRMWISAFVLGGRGMGVARDHLAVDLPATECFRQRMISRSALALPRAPRDVSSPARSMAHPQPGRITYSAMVSLLLSASSVETVPHDLAGGGFDG